MTKLPHDSRMIYNAASHLASNVSWEATWQHFGTGIEVKYTLIKDLIDDYLGGEEVIFVNERLNSRYVKRQSAIEVINPLLGKEAFKLWDESMGRVIDFHEIGVLRLGRKS